MAAGFVLFGFAHRAVMAATLASPLALTAAKRKAPRLDILFRYSLAVLLLGGWASWYVLFWMRGWLGIGNELPLNLCDWAAIALIVALIRPSQIAYELGYFWGLAGTLHGLVTPPLLRDFPDPQFIFFFINHGGIIASLLYLTIADGWRPWPKSLPRVIAATLGYAAVAGFVDWQLGVNYGLLRAKPDNFSILDFLSPWPVYIPELVLIGILSVGLYYAPFWGLDSWRGRKSA